MKEYKFYNTIGGWVVFAIAALTYILTMEPTASFWDCGEFIATAYKLEVGHPPGAPLFLMMARVFSLLSFGDVTQVAKMVNLMSALASAFTIMFLFWTITHIAKKIVIKNEEYNLGKTIAILGCGLIGALAYAFSDTFWFSAVEGEVYATSSLFTAVVFWAILKWENIADEPYSNRWLVLIAYLIGLSIGVHLLNLLAIPSMVFVYYFKKHKTTTKGVILTALIGVIITGFVQYGIIPGTISLASKFELAFVNGFGLPYNVGVVFYSISLISGLIFGIYYTWKKRKVILNTLFICVSVIILGYGSFAMVVIRSLANPPMDENNPENLFTLLPYLNREQYGNNPLLFGHYYNAPVEDVDYNYAYLKENKKYKAIKSSPNYTYYKQYTTFFPRMYSWQQHHINGYKSWVGNFKGKKVRSPQGKMDIVPTFGENLAFFFKYQVGHMYMRYFMWNFAGRQNDVQGHGGILKGNWLSGIPILDEVRLGSQEDLPDYLAKNKARNKYFMLPLLLGIIGAVILYQKHTKYFWVVILLFFFTGLAIVLYTNQPPYQPRERDYAYAGSFYAFSIFIGLGVLSIYYSLKNSLNAKTSAIIATCTCLIVPTIMVAQNWDDHDRSGRYSVKAIASNMLNSCEKNALLFTYGDNDTFPLWYAQEVEGIRTDVRIVNLSLLGTDWYINQMRMKAYESAPVEMSMKPEQYQQGTRDVMPVVEKFTERIELINAMNFIASDKQGAKIPLQDGRSVNYLPARKLKLQVDKDMVLKNNIVPDNKKDKILSQIEWNISKNSLTKSDMMLLDIVATNNWKRPIYFAVSPGNDNFMGMEKYFRLEGFAYRLVPYIPQNPDGGAGGVATDIMYENMVKKFTWGRISEPDVFVDQQNIRTMSLMGYRENFARLAMQLINENKKEKAIEALDKCFEINPAEKVPYNYQILSLIASYYAANSIDKANFRAKELFTIKAEELEYYLKLDSNLSRSLSREKQLCMLLLQETVKLAKENKQDELVNKDFLRKYNQLKILYQNQR